MRHGHCARLGASSAFSFQQFRTQAIGMVVILACLMLSPLLHAASTRSQTLALHRGWNAVFLQVTPTNQDPAAIFANTPVQMVATYFAVEKPVQYIRNPGSTSWNKDGWGIWYSANRSDAFLSSLHALYGNRAYLIFSKQDFTWTVNGTVAFASMRWKGNSFNLTGLGVDETSPPTFDQFFSASAAHKPYRIYRLLNDQWTLVADPIATPIRSGEAYWIYCKGGSDYQGPLRAKLMAGQGIDFGASSDAYISFSNESGFPMTVQVQTVASGAGLPLSYTVRGITQGAMVPVSVPLPPTYSLPTLESGDSTSFFLKLRRENMTNPVQNTLLKIGTDNGLQLWVPVTGSLSLVDSTAAQ